MISDVGGIAATTALPIGSAEAARRVGSLAAERGVRVVQAERSEGSGSASSGHRGGAVSCEIAGSEPRNSSAQPRRRGGERQSVSSIAPTNRGRCSAGPQLGSLRRTFVMRGLTISTQLNADRRALGRPFSCLGPRSPTRRRHGRAQQSENAGLAQFAQPFAGHRRAVRYQLVLYETRIARWAIRPCVERSRSMPGLFGSACRRVRRAARR